MVAGQLVDQYGRQINGYGQQQPDPYYEDFNQAGGPRVEVSYTYMINCKMPELIVII